MRERLTLRAALQALAGLVVGLIVPPLRLSGRRLPRRLRLGWRRVVMDTAPLVAVIVSFAYLGLAVAYWFRAPVIGVGLAAALFTCAWTLHTS